jgi:predicted RNase H-like HicB family nuclease
MKFKIVIHEAEEGGYWANVPALPGCVSEGETMEEMLANIREAIQCYLDEPDQRSPTAVNVPIPSLPERAFIKDVEV